jgi:predicted Zn-dependent protease
VDWDDASIARELERLAPGTDEIADVFGERLVEISIPWRDGEPGDPRVRREDGVAARRRARSEERLSFVSGWGDAAVHSALRGLRGEAGDRASDRRPASPSNAAEALSADAARWVRRLPALLTRHAPRHRLRLRLLRTERRVVSARRPAAESARRLVSIEGIVVAASRLGDEERPFAFHAPDAGAVADELKAALVAATAPRDRPIPATAGETDAVLANGCAAVLFHEILAHALEADADRSPLASATEARLTAPDLDVHDDPRRLDLFGGYGRDDEGTAPRAVKLIQSGRLGSRLTDRAAGGRHGSSGHGRRAAPSEPPQPRTANVVVAAGSATSEELVRRLGSGLWIDEIHAGSAEPSSGSFRLAFHRARRVHRGRLAEEIGPGTLFGEVLPALRRIEPMLGRDAHACRSLGWCARDGRVLPVQGEAPDVLVRALSVRPAR